MDPDRVRAYLQVACAGLGFDIGEIWWTTNEDSGSSSALAKIEETDDDLGNREKKLRFVQLYTSKSYEDRRSMLVRPADEEENYNSQVNGSDMPEDSPQDLKKHVLSPIMVDAISKTAQVVWAHTKKTEGLTGRSDIRLQTAVGMPVAVDREGNMCVVVMFSPNNIHSTDDALEYLQSISRSATSATIPTLFPAFDPKHGLIHVPHHHAPTSEVLPLLSNILSDGVTTRFVSLDETPEEQEATGVAEVQSDHDLVSAPRDCFGIPMLPKVAELGSSQGNRSEVHGDSVLDAFDEASYGVWSTIMQTYDEPYEFEDNAPGRQNGTLIEDSKESFALATTMSKPCLETERQERLQEFASAFLDVSVFDLAEVWLPIGQESSLLSMVTSVTSSNSTNATLNEFTRQSQQTLIEFWSGAVGRAHSSGNPVWSYNKEVFADSGRMSLFEKTKIQTVLAVPVFSGKSNTPAFVFCCYSFVRTGSVPFVLKFVQQALRLLWGGLDKVQPHSSVGHEIWRDVAPADLGEMAADVEMQQHFMVKKRPIGAISNEISADTDVDLSLTEQINSLEPPSGEIAVRSIYSGQESQEDWLSDLVDVVGEMPSSPKTQPVQFQTFVSVQSHIQDAIRSVGGMTSAHQHISTNADGSKRAHVFHQEPSLDYYTEPYEQPQHDKPLQLQEQSQMPQNSQYQQQQQQQQQLYQQQDYQIQLQPEQFQSQQVPAQQYQSQQPPPQPQQYQQQQPQQYQMPLQYQQPQQYQQQQPHQPQQPQQYLQQQQPQQFLPQQPQQYHQPQQFQQQQPPQFQQVQQQPIQQTQPQQYQQLQPQQYQPQEQLYQNPSAQVHQPVHQQPQFQQPSPQLAPSPQVAPQNGFLSAVPAPLPLPLPLPLPNQVLRPCGSSSPSFQQHLQDSYSSPSPQQPVAPPEAVPDRIVEVADLNDKKPYNNTGLYGLHLTSQQQQQQQEPSPNPVYSVPVELLSATGMSFTAPPQVGMDQPQMNHNSLLCMPTADEQLDEITGGPNGKTCRIIGCTDDAVARRPYCIRHSGNRMCEHEGCPKCAQGSTRFCIAHGGGRRCTFAGCDKGARDKFFCAAHGGGKRCRFDGCDKSAVGGSSLCTSHGGGRRCVVDGCDKSAQSSTRFCVKHGGGKKCSHPDCEKVARGRTHFCAAHGGGVRCKLAGCNRVAIGKLQLCRAHGGGARPKNGGGGGISSSSSNNSSSNGGNSSSSNLSMLSDVPTNGGGVTQQQQQQPPPMFQPMTAMNNMLIEADGTIA